MTAPTTASPARCAAVWTAATVAAAALAALLVPAVAEARTALAGPFDQLLVWTCATLALVAVAWLWAATTALVVEALHGGGRRTPCIPVAVRRLVLAACGVAVSAGLAAPVHATPGDLHQDRARPATSIAGLPFPDRAVGTPGGAVVSAGRPVERDVLVRPGDTLWSLAREDLGPGADDAEVAARWQEIYARNRAVIGADPDLIRPAQRLRLPAG